MLVRSVQISGFGQEPTGPLDGSCFKEFNSNVTREWTSKINLPLVINNQKYLSTQIANLSQMMGPPGQQNVELARIIEELNEHTRVVAATASMLEERGRVAANLSSGAQPLLEELVSIRREQQQMREEVQQMKQELQQRIDAKQCCHIS